MAAVERIRSAHRLGRSTPFDQSHPAQLWQQRADEVVQKSNYLALAGGIDVDDAMLERELLRMLLATTAPLLLEEELAALGGDRMLIKECLVRPLLVERLLAEMAGNGAKAWHGNPGPGVQPPALLPGLGAKAGSVRVPPVPSRCSPGSGCSRHLPAPSWWLNPCPPEPRTGHVMVWTGTELIIWGGHDSDSRPHLYDPLLGRWRNGSSVNAPTARSGATAVWTGSEMIVWGGDSNIGGGRYDPRADTWLSVRIQGGPSERIGHTAAWTGAEMIVWGGMRGEHILDDGAAYDPVSDTWRHLPLADQLAARIGHTAVWTGAEMIVWGGTNGDNLYYDDGAVYDPEADSWRRVPGLSSGLSSPSARSGHEALWTDEGMVIVGGLQASREYLIRYDLDDDRWTYLETPPPMAPAGGFSAVATGSELIIWGGTFAGYEGDPRMYRYDMGTASWTTTYDEQQPTSRSEHAVVWTGDAMVVWGGTLGTSRSLATGGLFRPETSTWERISDCGTPDPRQRGVAVWTGAELVVWGGWDYVGSSYSGRYDPAADTWLPVSMVNAPVEDGATRIAAWTGEEVLIWGYGGWDEVTSRSKPGGGRYDPVTNTWTRMSVDGAPAPTEDGSAVWTGSELIVWDGSTAGAFNYTGAYDPQLDVWRRISLNSALSDRRGQSVVWTGEEMIVWGGVKSGSEFLSNGASYNPRTDSWRPVSAVDAPEGRVDHSAVWTGEEMIIWGGRRLTNVGNPLDLADGARYDPAENRWTPLAEEGAPSARSFHSAAWTGSGMFVWGGASNGGDGIIYGNGAVYLADEDRWETLLASGAPDPRCRHTAVFTGEMVLIWGGGQGLAAYVVDSE